MAMTAVETGMKSSFDIAEKYLSEAAATGTEAASADLSEGAVVACLIDSTILGAEIWFALRDDWRPDEGDSTPVFYASELAMLREKTPEQLREIHKAKLAFGPATRVRQDKP